MYPVSFDESNGVLGEPAEIHGIESNCQSVCFSNHNGQPVVISCWKMTKEELEEINRTGRVWMGMFGTVAPPMWLSGTKPFLKGTNERQEP